MQRKLRKRQRNNLVRRKYALKKARLAHASAMGKLIINSNEERNKPTTIYAEQSNAHIGQSQDYAEQEQENFNKNLANLASTGLKSVIVDFEDFEANLFSKDNRKALQKEFTKKKQQKINTLRKRQKKMKNRSVKPKR